MCGVWMFKRTRHNSIEATRQKVIRFLRAALGVNLTERCPEALSRNTDALSGRLSTFVGFLAWRQR